MTEENPFKKEIPSRCPKCGSEKLIVNGNEISCADCSFEAVKGDYVND